MAGWRCALYFGSHLLLAPLAAGAASSSSNSAALPPESSANGHVQVQCLPDDAAFLRARLTGSVDQELVWSDRNMHCAGSVRPNAEGIRVRFAGISTDGEPALVLLFGITGLKEGESGKALPVNLTIMREGTGEFYATQGDNRCTVDTITQEPLQGIPLRQRAYRITARGFCTQPARALHGDGLILVTRFDFAGRADFQSDDAEDVEAPKTRL